MRSNLGNTETPEEKETKAFLAAVRDHDWETVADFVRAGTDIDTHGGFALDTAVKTRDENTVKMVLNLGADAGVGQSKVLRLAAFHNDVGIVRMLLDHGAQATDYSSDALRTASREGYAEMTALLLQSGANPNDYGGQSLSAAAANGHLDVVRVLLANGADVQCNDNKALFLAVCADQAAAVSLLLENGAQPCFFQESHDFLGRHGRTDALDCLTQFEQLQAERLFAALESRQGLSAAALREVIREDGVTGIMTAVRAGKIAAALQVLDDDIAVTDFTGQDEFHRTALTDLAIRGELSILFSAENWQKTPEVLDTLWLAVPDQYKEQVDIETVREQAMVQSAIAQVKKADPPRPQK